MTVEFGSVRGDRRKEILEHRAMSELEQEKALHQLAVERANRACERADAAEAEVERLRAKVEYWKGRRDAAADVRGLNVAKERAETAEAERDAAREALARAWDEGFKQGGPMCDVDYDDPDAGRRNPYRAALAQPVTDEGAGA